MPSVVTVFLEHGGEVLCIHRSDTVSTYPGYVATISGYVEPETTDPVADAWREVREETGKSDVSLVRRGEPLTVVDGEYEWTVHPFLFRAASRAVDPNHEFDDWEWLPPTALIDRETVPGLWKSYRRVAPTIDLVRTDTSHGSTWLSLRALEVLRDEAGAIAFGAEAATATGDMGQWDTVAGVARELRDARPGMVVIRNRINRVMAEADRTPTAVHDRAIDAIDDALDADSTAATLAAEFVAEEGEEVATLSQSGTVATALETADCAVLLAESRPACEGTSMAESLAGVGLDVTLTTDAALPGLIRDRDVGSVLLGADRVLSDGAVVNKVGSYPAALAAHDAAIPVFVVTSVDKIAPEQAVVGESGDPRTVYDGEAAVQVENPIFERFPADSVDAIVTESGMLEADAIAEIAREHGEIAAWDRDS